MGTAVLGEYYNEDTHYYKYKKLGDIWTDEYSFSLNYTLKADSGYTYVDNTGSSTVYFSNYEKDLLVHYNYKKQALEVKMHSSVPEGTQLKISLMDQWDYDSATIYAAGSGTVKNNWVSIALQDETGAAYVPEYDMYCCVYYEMYDEEEAYWQTWSSWEDITWYNYDRVYGTGDVESYVYANPIRTTDTSFAASAYLNSDSTVGATDVKLVLEGTDGTALQTAALTVTEGTAYSKEVEVKLASALAEGNYTLKLMKGETVMSSTQLSVYDKNKFYMNSQSGYVDGTTLTTYFYSDQVYAEYYRESGAVDMYDADDYTITVYDRLGNQLKTGKPTKVWKSGSNRVYMTTTVPEGYTGFYARIERNGQLGLLDFGSTAYLYGSYSSYHKTYGRWVSLSSPWMGIDFIEERDTLHGIIGIYGNSEVTYPVTVQIREVGTDTVKKEFKVSSTSNYYFTASDVSGLEEDEIYNIAVFSANGESLGTATGYVVYDSSRVKTVAVTGIKLNETSLALGLGEGNNSAQLSVTYTPSNANSGTALTWTTSDENVATVTNGLVKAVGLGSATITATTANGKTAKCTVKVQNYSISQSELTLNVFDIQQLTVSDGITAQSAKWSSSNEAVATVDAKGNVEAIGKGTAVITAVLSNGMEFTCNVTVTNELKSIAFQKTEGILEVGAEDTLEITYMPANEAENYEITWASSDTNVAAVENGVVKALAEGTVTITASATTTAGVLKATCTYEVKNADVATPIEEGFYVYALTNVDTTLAAVQDQLPEGWEWVTPDRGLDAFKGMLEKDFAVQYVNENTGEITYDEVTIKFSTIRNLKLTNLPAKIAVGVPATAIATYEVLGEDLDTETLNGLTWSVSYAPKAKTNVVTASADGSSVTLNALKAGSTKLLVELKCNGETVASLTQKVTAVANKAGVANLDVALVDANGNSIEAVNGVYTLQITDQVYLKNNTAVSDVTGKAFKVTYKSLDTSVVKIGKADKLEPTKTALTLAKAGTVVITATANDTLKSAVRLQFKVEDRTPAGITLSENTVTLNTTRTDASVTLKVYNGFGAELTNAVLTSGSELCDIAFKEDGTITVSPKATTGKGGKATLEVTVSDGSESVSQIFKLTIKVAAKKPSVTVKQLTKVNTFYGTDGTLSVGTVGGSIADVKIKEADFGYAVVKEDGQWKLRLTDASKMANKKCTLLIYVDGYQEPVQKKLTIGTETLSLGLSVTSGTVYGDAYKTIKVQVMNKKAKAAMNLLGATVTVDNSNYTVAADEYNLVITAKEAPAKTEKINITLSNSLYWKETRTFAFTVKAVDAAKAKLQLGAKSLTLYNYGNGIRNSIDTTLCLSGGNNAAELLKNVQITAADKKTRAVLNQTLVVAYDESTGKISANINGDGPAAGTYKFNLVLKSDLFAKDLKAALTIKVVNVPDMSKCVTVKAKGKIDVLNRDATSITLTPKFSKLGTNASVFGYRLTGTDAHLFEIVSIANNALTIRLKDDVHVITKYAYSVNVRYYVESGNAAFKLESAPIRIKLTQGKAKVTPTGANVFSSTAEETKALKFIVTNSMGEKVEVEKVKLLNYQNDFSYDLETGKLSHALNGETARGKTYALKFEIYLNDRGDNEKPITVTYKVKIAK